MRFTSLSVVICAWICFASAVRLVFFSLYGGTKPQQRPKKRLRRLSTASAAHLLSEPNERLCSSPCSRRAYGRAAPRVGVRNTFRHKLPK